MTENSPQDPTPDPNPPSTSDSSADSSADSALSLDQERQTNQWAMFLHFSILAGWIVPLAGLVLPIILWQIKKDELPGIIPHAHVVLNWIVTSLVYALICMVLTIILIGAFGFVVLCIVTVIFSIIGGIKANEGVVWEYPGTIVKVFK